MPRFHLTAAVFAAVLIAGCGGSSSLLATVPPPVEFNGGTVTGLVELPAGGDYQGSLLVEHIEEEPNGVGGWSEFSTELSNGRGEATVGKSGTIELRAEGDSDALFSGTMTAKPAAGSHAAVTNVKLKTFDGHQETYIYTLTDGSPKQLEIVARGNITQTGQRFEFDRYTFILSL